MLYYVGAHQGHVILCRFPSGPGYIMSVPIRARLHGQCPTGPGYIMSVPIRARLYVSAQQGQVIGQCPAGPGISAQQGQERGWRDITSG